MSSCCQLGCHQRSDVSRNAGGRQASGGELRERLAQDLPEYMLPAAFVYLDALPLTPNCKVDRKSLRALPVTAMASGHEHTDPRTETEVAIAKLWSEMLGVARVGPPQAGAF